MISEIIEKWIKGILIDGITGNLSGLFDNVNAKVDEIASDVGSTPQAWNSGIFNMLRSLSETVVLPIAAAILALVMCHELIQMITEKNNMHDFDTSMFFRWIFKSAFAILIVSNTWNIVMGVFDATQSVVNQSSGVIIGETSIHFDRLIPGLEFQLESMTIGSLLSLWFQTLVVGLTMNILSICIYQLRNEDSTRDYRFEPYDRLQAAGQTVDKANYTEVYSAPLAAGTTLEDIYRTFNVDHPADFKGHSLSVSDVVVLHQNGHDTAHYCDSVGFQQVPEFLRENPLRTAELSTEQNENMIDGVLNNAPSLGELEAKARAGEPISLTDLAAAVKAEEKAPKAKKSRTAKPKKPSIRAQLDAAKKEQSKQTPPREKTKELEV